MKNFEWEMAVRYLKGESDDEEQKQMEGWLQDPQNRQYFEKLKRIWEASGEVYKDYSPDLAKAWKNIESGISQQRKSFTMWHWVGRAAAIFIVTAGVVWFIMQMNLNKTPVGAMLLEISTGSDIDSVQLADGSVIWLNRHTTVRYPEDFTGEERRVYLSGEAFFKVTSDPEHPFIVESQGTMTRVLGTSFNIKTNAAKTSIAVITGRVSFSEKGNPDNFAVLVKGEAGQYDSSSPPIRKANFDDPNVLSWKTGILIFQNASLSKVAETLSDHYHKPVSVDVPEDESLSLTTSFEMQSLEEALEVVCMTLDLRYEENSGEYILKK